jgi:hypothetical protein
MTAMRSTVEPTVESAVKSTMAVEMVEVPEGMKAIETIGRRKPRPTAIVSMWVIPVPGSSRATRENDHREHGGAK